MVSLRTTASNTAPLYAPGGDGPAEIQLATTNGISLALVLAEPTLFVCGFAAHEHSQQSPAILRGSIIVRCSKPTKLKTITLSFKGVVRTEWPEGIPPKRTENYEAKDIHSHVWPFFNASFTEAEHSSGAHLIKLTNGQELGVGPGLADAFSHGISSGESTPPYPPPANANASGISMKLLASKLRRTASPSPSRAGNSLAPISSSNSSVFDSSLHPHHSNGSKLDENEQDTTHKGYRIFLPGEYVYNFELPIPHSLPESMQTAYGSIKYHLEALVERYGTFKTNLAGIKEVEVVRTTSVDDVETSEPITISRDWDDQLRYEIAIAGKAFPIGSEIPLALRMVPLTKVRAHRFRVYITENSEYYCKKKKVHRIEPTKKFLIKETVPEDGLHGTLLSYDDGEELNHATELEYDITVPKNVGKAILHPNHISDSIEVHHWLKMVLRLSKVDEENPEKRRYFEISIDTPITLLHSASRIENTILPEYRESNRSAQNGQSGFAPLGRMPSLVGVPTVSQSASSSDEHLYDRPIHLIRMPSTAPPPFTETEDDRPPQYEAVIQEEREENANFRRQMLLGGHRISHREARGHGSPWSSVSSFDEFNTPHPTSTSTSNTGISSHGSGPGEASTPSANDNVEAGPSGTGPSHNEGLPSIGAIASQFKKFTFAGGKSKSPLRGSENDLVASTAPTDVVTAATASSNDSLSSTTSSAAVSGGATSNAASLSTAAGAASPLVTGRIESANSSEATSQPVPVPVPGQGPTSVPSKLNGVPSAAAQQRQSVSSEQPPIRTYRGRARTREQSERDITDMLRASQGSILAGKHLTRKSTSQGSEVDDEFEGGDLAVPLVMTRSHSADARPLLSSSLHSRHDAKGALGELFPMAGTDDQNLSTTTIDQLQARGSLAENQSVESLWIT